VEEGEGRGERDTNLCRWQQGQGGGKDTDLLAKLNELEERNRILEEENRKLKQEGQGGGEREREGKEQEKGGHGEGELDLDNKGT
jgi:hypothetical protein